MKKNIILYSTLGLTIIISVIVYIQNKQGTIKKELKDFAFEDTSLVNKIFLANKSNQTILLEKVGPSKWIVNKKYTARLDAIKNLLDAIASIQVKSPVPKSAVENVTKLLATRSTKVEIYSENKLVKTYYVGEPTQDNLGTYMILEKSSVPFIVHKPGFNGYLTVRYFVNEIEWRDVSLFMANISQLHSVSVEYPEQIENSFQIIRKSAGKYELQNLNNKPYPYTDTFLLKETVISILKAKADRWLTDKVQEKIDSLKNIKPIAIITIKTINGDKQELKLYKKYIIKNISEKEKSTELNPDVMYGLLNYKELTYCQYFTFDPLLLKISDFSTSK